MKYYIKISQGNYLSEKCILWRIRKSASLSNLDIAELFSAIKIFLHPSWKTIHLSLSTFSVYKRSKKAHV